MKNISPLPLSAIRLITPFSLCCAACSSRWRWIIRKIIKTLTVPILIAALLAFGGRIALIYVLMGLVLLTSASLWQALTHQRMTMLQLYGVIAA